MGYDTGLEAKLRGIFDKLRKDLPATLEAAGHVMAAQAALAAPSPEEEYETMQVGEGNPEGITNVPPMPTSLGGTDGDHRLRFYKPAEMYLQNVIMEDVHAQDLTVGIGDEEVLDASSMYEWRNVTGQVFECDFPFWECWEGGLSASFFISPRSASGKRIPTLKPGIGKENQRYFMYKSIPRKRMYGGVDVDAVIENAILPAVRKIARET